MLCNECISIERVLEKQRLRRRVMEAILNQSKDMAVNFDFRKSLCGMTRCDVKISEQAYHLCENESSSHMFISIWTWMQ